MQKDTPMRVIMKTTVGQIIKIAHTVPGPLRPFWSYRDKLSTVDSVVLKGEKILDLIPRLPHEELF